MIKKFEKEEKVYVTDMLKMQSGWNDDLNNSRKSIKMHF